MVIFLINKRKRVYLAGVSSAIALLILFHTISLASAAPAISTFQRMQGTGAGGEREHTGSPQPVNLAAGNQQNNQSFRGISNSGNKAQFVGNNQGNTGNQGVNRGLSQDNSVNSGNMVSGQKKSIGVQENNQSLQASSGGGNSSTLVGSNQGNSGNQGVNLGNNQDNANNSGNQVNNQGNIIGTQINKQGSTVNNQGNIIEHQINYLSLLPGLHLYLSLRPLQVGLSTAEQDPLPQAAQQQPNVAPIGGKTNR